MNAFRFRPWLAGLFLIAATAIAYAPSWNGGFIWDDDDYVTNNPLLTAPDGLRRIWFSLDSPSQYFPLVYTTFRIEHALWGLNPTGYHWVNLLLHIANALLLWRLLVKLRIPGAYLAAAIFALHPVQVESVAWITERKNVLMGFFFLLTLLAWMKFTDAATRRRRLCYALALVTYLLALSAKTTACTLPAALLLILWLQKKPIDRRRLGQIVPFLLLGFGMGLVTIWWERYHVGTRGALFALGPLERVLIASRAIWFYLGKLFWPSNLTFIYPRWNIDPTNPLAYAWLIAGAALGALIYFARRVVGQSVEVGALFFIATLSPLLGFIMLYTFRYTFVADHYQYIACIGPIALAATGITLGLDSFPKGKAFLHPAVGGSLLLILATLTWRQSHQYRDLETLWRTTIARNPECWMAEGNLAGLLLEKGDLDEAIAHYEKAVGLWPGHAEAHNNLGNALLKKGMLAEAMVHFRKVVEIWPNELEAHNNIGGIYLQTGRIDEGIAEFEKVLALDPAHARAQNNLGNALLQKGRIDEAIAHYEITLTLPFDHAEAQYNLGNALMQKGDLEQAIAHYRVALAQRPNRASTENNLGNALERKGRVAEALGHYEKATALEPAALMFQNNLAWILATAADTSLRDPTRALQLAEQANRSSGGNNPIILRTLAAANAANGRFPSAAAFAERALQFAETQGDAALAETLRNELVFYQISISPFAHSN